MNKKVSDYELGVRFANKTIRDSKSSLFRTLEISKLHDEADKKMYRKMHEMRTSKERLVRQSSKQLYWFNRGKATAYGYFHHNGKLLKKRKEGGK